MSHEGPRSNRAEPPPPERISFPLQIHREEARRGYAHAQPIFEARRDKQQVLFYQESLGPSAEYRVYRFDDRWEFQLLYEDRVVGDFVFKEERHALHLQHRLVEAKALGVTGTMFLKKAEDYLAFLQEEGVLLPTKPLLLNAGQKEVILWALKNGFAFDPPEQKQAFEDIVSDEEGFYRTDVEDIPEKNGFVRRGYILSVPQHAAWEAENALRREAGHVLIHASDRAIRFQLVKHFSSQQV